MISRLSVLLIFLVILLDSIPASYADELPTMPRNHVVDLAGIIDGQTEAQLNGYLLELEQKTTAQVVVLTVRSLEGEPIEKFSLSVAHDRWKLGQKDKDNGVLITVALQDRKYRIEVGYGLEGILPDSLVGSIGRQNMVPRFRQGDYSGGITAATIVVAHIIAKDSGVEITGMPAVTYQPRSRAGGESSDAEKVMIVIVFFFIVGFILLSFKHPGTLIYGAGRSRYWGGGFGGGGFGGGGGGFGGGGFGGGGGGGFGGGGASGGW